MNSQENILFKTCFYHQHFPKYVDVVNTTSKKPEYNLGNDNPKLPHSEMGVNINLDKDISEFADLVIQESWNILKHQGYKMEKYSTYYQGMWAQIHHKDSHMPVHVHPFGCQIVGFYFLEIPDDSCKVMFYDSNAGKVQNSLEIDNNTNISNASNILTFSPKVGDLIFTNAWLPHAYTGNNSDQDFRFIHINIGVLPFFKQAEVI